MRRFYFSNHPYQIFLAVVPVGMWATASISAFFERARETIHADRNPATLEHAGELGAGELAAPSLRWGRLWSVLKISGMPCRAKASCRTSTQKSAPSVFDSRHPSTARLCQSLARDQLEKALDHRDIEPAPAKAGVMSEHQT
jgi:hypothetical protein